MNEFAGFALFAPVLTALSGNAGSIFVSRISTALHSSSTEHYAIVAATLFAITSPVLVVFLGFAWLTGQAPVSFTFALAFVAVVCLQVCPSQVHSRILDPDHPARLRWRWPSRWGTS